MCLHLLTYPSGGKGNITVLKFFPIQHVILKGIPLHDRCEVKGVQLQQSVQQVYAACWIQTMQYQPSNIMRCLIMSKQYVSQCVLVLMEFTVAVFICFFFFMYAFLVLSYTFPARLINFCFRWHSLSFSGGVFFTPPS